MTSPDFFSCAMYLMVDLEVLSCCGGVDTVCTDMYTGVSCSSICSRESCHVGLHIILGRRINHIWCFTHLLYNFAITDITNVSPSLLSCLKPSTKASIIVSVLLVFQHMSYIFSLFFFSCHLF